MEAYKNSCSSALKVDCATSSSNTYKVTTRNCPNVGCNGQWYPITPVTTAQSVVGVYVPRGTNTQAENSIATTARGFNNCLYYNWLNILTGVWSGWAQIPGTESCGVISAPATYVGTSLDVQVEKPDQLDTTFTNPWHIINTGTGWQNWFKDTVKGNYGQPTITMDSGKRPWQFRTTPTVEYLCGVVGPEAICDSTAYEIPGIPASLVITHQPVGIYIPEGKNSQYANTIGVVAKGADNGIYYTNYFIDRQKWLGYWIKLDGATKNAPYTYVGDAWDIVVSDVNADSTNVWHNINWLSGWGGWKNEGALNVNFGTPTFTYSPGLRWGFSLIGSKAFYDCREYGCVSSDIDCPEEYICDNGICIVIEEVCLAGSIATCDINGCPGTKVCLPDGSGYGDCVDTPDSCPCVGCGGGVGCGFNGCEPNLGESCATCSGDCGVCVVSGGAPTCGANGCETSLGESCTTCSTDCGACSPPPPPPVCTEGSIQCTSGKHQTCSSNAWTNTGTDADGDGVDAQCGDSLCDNANGIIDLTKTSTEMACGDSLNNDCDSTADCADSDCSGISPCCTNIARDCKSYSQDVFEAIYEGKLTLPEVISQIIGNLFYACPVNTFDTACCPQPNMCVFNGVCYPNGFKGDLDDDGVREVCVGS